MVVPHSCDNKAISAPSWGLAGWLGLSLAKMQKISFNTLGLSCAKLSQALASYPLVFAQQSLSWSQTEPGNRVFLARACIVIQQLTNSGVGKNKFRYFGKSSCSLFNIRYQSILRGFSLKLISINISQASQQRLQLK